MKWMVFIFSLIFFIACQTEKDPTTPAAQEVKTEKSTPTVSDLFPKTDAEKERAKKQKKRAIEKEKIIRKGKAPIRIDLQEKIEKMHEKLMYQMEEGLNVKDVVAYAKESELYTNTFGDSLGAEYLFNAGDLYRGIEDYPKALEMWYIVYTVYNDIHPKAPHALFQCGFVYDSILNRKDLAKNLFLKFLKRYPKHALANDVKVMLKNIDKSPEDLIKEFQKKNSSQ